jgi:ribosomal-protein-serine acetyltransferase
MFSYQVDEDIQLKILELRHSEELFSLTDRDRAHLREWLPWVDGTKTVENTREFIKFTIKGFAENNGFNAAIFYNNEIVGCIGLHEIDWNNKKTPIGYWIGSEYVGRGIMTKSCRAVVSYVFNELKLNRVEIRAGVFNKKSRAIPERLGFSQEGTIKCGEWLYDHYIDSVIYGMLRADWK